MKGNSQFRAFLHQHSMDSATDTLDETNVKHLLKHIGSKNRLLTYGYFRQNMNQDQFMPDPIINICLVYAFLMIEYLIAKT